MSVKQEVTARLQVVVDACHGGGLHGGGALGGALKNLDKCSQTSIAFYWD